MSNWSRHVDKQRGICYGAAEGPDLCFFPVDVLLGSPDEVIQAMTSSALQVIPQGGSSSYFCLKGHELLVIVDPFCLRRFIFEAFDVCL